MLKREQLHSYQVECVNHIMEHNDAMLWLQLGLGKTNVTLTAIVDRMARGEVKKVLVFGPLRVIQSVWARECEKWEHTAHLRCSVLHGNKKKRLSRLFREADIYLCNYEAMNWLAEQLHHYYISRNLPLPFEMVVYDEVTCVKNSNTRRMSGGKKDVIGKNGETKTLKTIGWRSVIDHFKYRVGLTGTPASNGYLDLHGQFLAVDGGKRLGEYITGYKDRYFKADYMGWSHSLSDDNKKAIEERISDIVIKMDAKDYLDMPAVNYIDMFVELPEAARKAYEEVQEELFTVLDNGTEIELFSKQSVSNKCLQFCQGSPYYGETKEYTTIHTAKFDALEEILEGANGQPVLCSYMFRSDATEIMKRFKKYKPVNLTDTPSKDTRKVIDNWNAGKIKLLIGHPKSVGHGIDGLQDSGSILVWFGITWSLELYLQMNGRLDRQGQKKPVSIIRILCQDTIDVAVLDAIINKEDTQEGLKRALDRFRKGTPKLKPTF